MNFFPQPGQPLAYQPGQHWPALDGLRGLAILSVLLYHCFPLFYKFGSGIGWVGVDLFFVLSGFLITGILVDQKGKPSYFGHFMLNRALRIFPLYFLFLLFFFVFLPLIIGSDWVKSYQYCYDHS